MWWQWYDGSDISISVASETVATEEKNEMKFIEQWKEEKESNIFTSLVVQSLSTILCEKCFLSLRYFLFASWYQKRIDDNFLKELLTFVRVFVQ